MSYWQRRGALSSFRASRPLERRFAGRHGRAAVFDYYRKDNLQ
jgi:hypothetical protein